MMLLFWWLLFFLMSFFVSLKIFDFLIYFIAVVSPLISLIIGLFLFFSLSSVVVVFAVVIAFQIEVECCCDFDETEQAVELVVVE